MFNLQNKKRNFLLIPLTPLEWTVKLTLKQNLSENRQKQNLKSDNRIFLKMCERLEGGSVRKLRANKLEFTTQNPFRKARCGAVCARDPAPGAAQTGGSLRSLLCQLSLIRKLQASVRQHAWETIPKVILY